MDIQSNEHVICPVCKGEGICSLPVENPTCNCCGGAGEITKTKMLALDRCKAKLKIALTKRGMINEKK